MIVVAEGGEAGGVGRYCVDLAGGLGPAAHVACLCPRPCEVDQDCWLAARCAAGEVALHRIAMPAKGWRSGLRGLVHLWRRTDRPIIHVNGRRGNFVALIASLAVPGLRYVTTVHGILGLHDRRNKIYRLVDQLAGRRSEAVIAVSEHSRSELVRAGSPEDRTITIPNALSRSDMRALRVVAIERAAPEPGKARIGFLGRLSPEKGTHELLSAARQICELRPGMTLDVAGDGADRGWLEEASRDLTATGCLRWRGTIDDVVGFLGDVDIVVMPSRNEGLPYALLEAMAAGCAVVAFEVGGIPEVVVGPTLGLLVAPGDVAALVAAVVRLGDDPAEIALIGANASAHVESTFTIDQDAMPIKEVYRRATRPAKIVEPTGFDDR